MAPNPTQAGQRAGNHDAHPVDGVYFGLMSGTSMDGCDGIAVRFATGAAPEVLAEGFVGFDDTLREALFALQQPGPDEIDREARAAQALATRYAACCDALRAAAGLAPEAVRAAGVQGQTIRHRPELGYTRQTNDPARVAELSGLDVVADFRSRDIAAHGQGAPLVPAFHATVFGSADETRVVCNLGGISNITILPAAGAHDGAGVRGFDCGPANALLDAWALRHLGKPFDEGGQFAARGTVDTALLAALLAEPYFDLPPPKSTGRDLFNPEWLHARLQGFAQVPPEAVQATLTSLTAVTIAREIGRHAADCRAVYVCGGGARNPALMRALADALAEAGVAATVDTTVALGVPPQQVEAIAFAWLAWRFTAREPGNIAGVTGAVGERVLGALYPR